MRTLSLGTLTAMLALAPLSGAAANDLQDGWNQFEAGVERGFDDAKAAAGRAADDIENAADDGATWIKEKFDDDPKAERKDETPPPPSTVQ